MRIVGGALRGRRFAARVPAGTRPTSDRAREAIASALESRGLIGGHVYDLFAGTGALAFEALSRGAGSADLFDEAAAACALMRTAAEELGLRERATVHRVDLAAPKPSWIGRLAPADLVFLDPPYARIDAGVRVLSALETAGKLRPGAAIVFEHGADTELVLPAPFDEKARYRYGDTRVLLAQIPHTTTETE
ncbi:MAG: RsmD family RNA methyltransferase [Sandaracinaceae bacterium]